MLRLDSVFVSAGNFRLRNLTFGVEKGEYFVVLGPSGVGKSLLLETIAGFRPLDSGSIYLRGENISSRRIQQRNISIVYQDADLFPHMSVYENVAYPLRCRKQNGIPEKVRNAAALVGIADKLNRKPETLSGGEYQRVSLARSIAAESDIILLDEPLSSVDSKARADLRSLLRTINRNGITVIHVTHDYEEAISVASKIGIMEHGALVHIDAPAEIFKHPKSEFVARFIGVKNFLKGVLESAASSELKTFTTNGIAVSCLTDAVDGEGFLMIGPDEITIANAEQPSSSRNHFKGVIKDLAQARLGFEVTVDIGCELIAIITSESRKSLDLEIGKEVWVSFKASSCKIYRADRKEV